MIEFLGIIEQRSNEILSAYHNLKLQNRKAGRYSIDSTPSASTQSILGFGPSIPMGSVPISINPPKLTDYASDDGSIDECDARPLTRNEIRNSSPARIHQHALKPEIDSNVIGNKKNKRGNG